MPKFGDVFRAYLVMMWFLFGAYLLYWVFTPINGELFGADMTTFVVGVIIVLVFILLFAPLVVLPVGIYCCISGLVTENYWAAVTSLAILAMALTFYLIWWGFWYVLYGRQQKWVRRTP